MTGLSVEIGSGQPAGWGIPLPMPEPARAPRVRGPRQRPIVCATVGQDVAAELRRRAAAQAVPLSRLVEETLRAGLAVSPAPVAA